MKYAVISAGEMGGQWQRVAPLLNEMRSRGLLRDVISFKAVMSACEKGGQWQRVAFLLGQMCSRGLSPD
eukprot:380679-Karenia_brevis.AAC.1